MRNEWSPGRVAGMRTFLRRIFRWEPGISLGQWAWDRITANWQWALSLLGTGGFFGWAAVNFDRIASHGWGAVIFAAVGMCCAIALTASFGLIAWRYFLPLPPFAPAPIEKKTPAGTDVEALRTPLRDPEFEADLHALLNFAVDEATALQLQELLRAAPVSAGTATESSDVKSEEERK